MAERGERPYVSFFDTGRNHRRSKGLPMPSESSATEFSSVAFSGDGKLALTQGAAPDWLLTLWHWDKAKPVVSVKTSPEPSRGVYQVSFNPVDPSIVCATGNGICKVRHTLHARPRPIPLTPSLTCDPPPPSSTVWPTASSSPSPTPCPSASRRTTSATPGSPRSACSWAQTPG